ncbi:MAG: hypothetical protein KME09_07370 [Pleurocapsa minor HA4230-MV1]|jgi:hypothetical protein|nr:hypothetical protein [Pleurocapsa minor HA4230-MV1]
MKLSFKDIKFILEALEHLLSRYDTRLKEIEDLEEYEEEASDLGNDYLFLESLKLEIEKNIHNNESSNHDFIISMSQATEPQNLEFIIQSTLSLSINERLLLVEAITQSIRKEAKLIAS